MVIVPPGQERDLRADERRAVLEQVLIGKVRVIVNVVAYGYHSFDTFSYTDNKLYQPGMSVAQFLEALTEEKRKEEIADLKKIDQIVQMSQSCPTLMLTLITKQDLWWPERNLVKEYYLESEYNQTIEGILRTRGSYNFSHEYISASLVVSNFDSGTGERLAAVAEGYDQSLQFTNLRNVFSKIDSFCQQR